MATRFAIATGNWSNPAIWDNGVGPVAGDFVYANGNTVTIDQNVNVGFISNGASPVYVPNIATPAMTSNNTPSGIASASTINGTNVPYFAFDQVTSSFWLSTASTGWLRYEFPTTKIIRRYAIVGTNATAYNPRNWTFEGSNDGTTWTVLQTVTLGAAIPANSFYDSGVFANSTPYLYYRLNITLGGGTLVGVAELQMTESSSSVIGYNPNGTFTMPTAFNITCTHPNGIINQATTTTAPCLTISATTGSSTLTSNIRGNTLGVANTIAVTISGNGHNITVNGDIYGGNSGNSYGLYRNASGALNVNGSLFGGPNVTTSMAIFNSALGTGTITVVGALSSVPSSSVAFCLWNVAAATINITGNIGGTTTGNGGGFLYNSGTSTITILGNITGATNGFTGVSGVNNAGNATINITGNINGGSGTNNHGITSTSGSITITGNILGGSSTQSHALNISGGIVTVNGTATGGSNGNAVSSNGTSVAVTGDVFAGAYPALASTSITTLFLVNGSIYNNGYIQAIIAARLGITPNTTMVYRLATNSGAAYNFYPVGSTALGTPATTDVRNGVTYASGALTGTLQVPAAANVLQGVPVDATIGTLLMTPQQFWDLLTSSATTAGSLGKLLVDNLNATVSSRATQTSVNAIPADVVTELGTSTDPIAVRLQNSSTVQTTGAQIAAYNV